MKTCMECCAELYFAEKGMLPICFKCYPKFDREKFPFLNCIEKGHSRLCKCPSNPLNKQLEDDINTNTYMPPTVTAADFPEPGKRVEEFLKSVTNEKDRIKLKMFFDKFR